MDIKPSTQNHTNQRKLSRRKKHIITLAAMAVLIAGVPFSANAASDTSLLGGVETGLLATRADSSSNRVMEEAVGLYLDGNLIGAVGNPSDLNLMLQSFLETYHEPGASVSFVEKVETVQGLYPVSQIFSLDDFWDILQGNGSNTPLNYTVKEGDTLETIAEAFHTTPEDLLELNGDNLSLEQGTTLHVVNNEPFIHVKSVKNDLYTEAIPYTTVVVPDTNAYTTQKQVTLEGQEGSQTCMDVVTCINGQEVERQNITRVVVAAAVNEVAVVGTIVPPDGSEPGVASGEFTWPVPTISNITSGFGARWGTNHMGLDISGGSSYGHTIVAADAGTVSYVKMDNFGYGYHLEISHKDGMSTMYAHTSEILVKAGEKVAKGQPIARIGSTGDSTGAHLHFEVHKNGVAVNPIDYVTA